MRVGISMVRWVALSVAGLICSGLPFPVAGLAQALECPIPQQMPSPSVLKETPVQIAELESYLGSGDDRNHVSQIVADLRKRYPGVENAEIENYLVTAYCPVAAKLTGLSRAERQARVDRFAHQASFVIYGH